MGAKISFAEAHRAILVLKDVEVVTFLLLQVWRIRLLRNIAVVLLRFVRLKFSGNRGR